MKIRISVGNKEKIESALSAVNGRANAHTYTALHEIEYLADLAESRLEKLGLPKSRRAGAEYLAVSGSRVPNAYAAKGRSRVATFVKIVRTSGGWYIVAIEKTEIDQDGGNDRLIITTAQDQEAVENLRNGYSVRIIANG